MTTTALGLTDSRGFALCDCGHLLLNDHSHSGLLCLESAECACNEVTS